MAALRGHLNGAKHLQTLSIPPDNSQYEILNGKWRKRAGVKRPHQDQESNKMSKREMTKKNKELRNIPILAQHTESKYEETETYFKVVVFESLF